MKNNKILIAIALLFITGALYRLIPNRPLGFAPQIAMALFGGALLKEKKWAFALPLLSMLLSDGLFEILYRSGVSNMQGFYEGQVINYLLLAGLAFIGVGMRNLKVSKIALGSIGAPILFFFASNFATWAGHGGYNHPMTASGLMQTLIDGLPFLYGSVAATVFFCAVLFGSWHFINASAPKSLQSAA